MPELTTESYQNMNIILLYLVILRYNITLCCSTLYRECKINACTDQKQNKSLLASYHGNATVLHPVGIHEVLSHRPKSVPVKPLSDL